MGQNAISGTRPGVLLALLIAGLALAAYFPALRGSFLWDDNRYAQHPVLAAPGGLLRVWTPKVTDQYYPMTYTSFWIERRLWGLHTLGYHAVNVALHVLNALLAWLILKRLGAPGAWLAAALFALHPVHAESVAWIAERKNLLSGFFYLLALASYLRFKEEGDKRTYAWALGLFLLALLSKTVVCTLPAIFLLLRWRAGHKIGRRDFSELAPFFAAAAVMAAVTIWVETSHAGTRGPDFELSFPARVIVAGRALWFYLYKLAWPAGLAFNYEKWAPDPGDALHWGWTAAAALAAALLWKGRGRRDLAAGAVFFAVTLAPALGFFKVYPQRYSFVADHFQYLASLGPISVAAGAAAWLARAWPARMKALAAVLLLGALGAATRRQAGFYAAPEILWRETLARNPRSFLAHVNLGDLLAKRGLWEEALRHNRRALQIKPDLFEAYNNLGTASALEGRREEALSYFERAARINPDSFEAHHNAGTILATLDRHDQAVSHYREAIRIKPDYAKTYYSLGMVLLKQGRFEEALQNCRAAVAINPNDADARNNLGFVLALRGDDEEALRSYREALRINPGHAQARTNLLKIPGALGN